MLQFRVFRTGLLATALVTAFAVPAAAAPAAPEAGTIVINKNKPARKAVPAEQPFVLKAEIAPGISAIATGMLLWDDTALIVRGAKLVDNGDGRSTMQVTAIASGAGPDTVNFDTSAIAGKATNFQFTPGSKYDDLLIEICKTDNNPITGKRRSACRTESFEAMEKTSMKARKAVKNAKTASRKAVRRG